MATYLGTTAIFEVRSTATAGNLGGGGFNPQNANFLTDGAATSATGNSPVFSSASYNFVAGDVGAWLYIKSGTNWTPGWYQIASVASNQATLSAAIGQASQISNNRFISNTVAGVATTASPTGATWGIDYSQQNAAQVTNNVLTGTTTSCTDATTPFGPQHVGNFICISTGTGVTAGWYEIVSVSGVTATLDRSAGASYSACTYYLGGAVSLGGSTTGITDAIFCALGASSTTSGCVTFVKGGSSVTYSFSGSVAMMSGSSGWQTIWEGYATTRGDRPTGSTRPTLSGGATFTISFTNNIFVSLQISGAASGVCSPTTSTLLYCKVMNNSSVASRNAISGGVQLILSEVVCYRGTAISMTANCYLFGSYIHDSSIGISVSANNLTMVGCILSGHVTEAIIANNSAIMNVYSNTFYGAENNLGIGITYNNDLYASMFYNNIFYGFTTALTNTANHTTTMIDYNDFYNNTTDVSTVWKGANEKATNPSFTNVSQVTGTTATSSGTTLTDSGKNFTTAGVVAGRDYLYVISGTGATVGIYGISTVGTTTLTTDLTIGTSNAGNLTYQITTGRNWLPTATLLGSQGIFPAGSTTGYLEMGAVQLQAGGGGSSASSFTFGS